MMEQQFFEDEFEQFLRENANQHRMYPTDGVWTNIYRHFHSGGRRVALGVLLILILTGGVLLVGTNTFTPAKQKIAGYSSKPAAFTNGSDPAETSATVTVKDIIAKLKAKSLVPSITIDAPRSLEPLHLDRKAQIARFSVPDNFQEATENFQEATENGILPVNLPANGEESGAISLMNTRGISGEKKISPVQAADFLAHSLPANSILSTSLPVNSPEARVGALPPGAKITGQNTLPAGIRTSIRQARLKNRLAYTMNFSPSIGYRNLFEGKTFVAYGNSPLMVRHMNVNQFVDHKPAVGFELGGGIRYQVSRILSIRTGLQFNLTRYSIAAFSHSPERTTLALNNQFGSPRDTLVATSNIRNLAGNNPERLHNQYLQVAVPIGAELRIFGDHKVQVNIAGSLQPGYLLNTDQYLLSSDFSNYVKEPSLLRRWNLASGLEASVSYQKGDTRWHFGPQFRYNLLSTYKKQYPIRENLMEYGVRIGVSKTIR